MNAARSGVSVVSYNDEIYALGGFNGYTRLKSVEKYSVERGGWTYVENMMNPRSNFSSVVLDEMIFVIGGFNGEFWYFLHDSFFFCTKDKTHLTL